MKRIETDPAFLRGEIVATSKTDDGGGEVVRWDADAKDWVPAPDIRFGDVAFLAEREGGLSNQELKEAGIKPKGFMQRLLRLN